MTADQNSPPEILLISLVHSKPEEVLHALSTVGFIHHDLEGTDITQADVDRAFELSALLHNVPQAERLASLKDERGNGYFGMKGSLDERATGTDLKESFVWGRYMSSAGEKATTQSLPKAVKEYQDEITGFDQKCYEASLRVLDILSRAFDLPENFFRSTHKDDGSNGMAFMNYPALEKPPVGDDIRAGSHKGMYDWDAWQLSAPLMPGLDWGDVTLLFQEKKGQPGLQVYLPTESAKSQTGIQLIQGDVDLESGTWISAPIIPQTVLVNVGLTLEGMTDGLCKANVHRVIFPKSSSTKLPKGRKTIAYFNELGEPGSTNLAHQLMNPVKPGGIIVEKAGASTVGDFFQERVRLAGIA
ncbi:unnamed protein product [Clonostachys rosea]|uniref:Isopenicillin N synthase-like Fe(2+) 2OG dioxygenase domain-containing protein n=1 Tax=Bionectria ochroleuca TaxID=29856 RepID=A0ABY6ULN3_BIOOC|nr:unnamed protein product [Clonostachys rosea]